MKTPLRFAILRFSRCRGISAKSGEALSFQSRKSLKNVPREEDRSVSRILSHVVDVVAIIPLGRALPHGSSDLPGGVARPRKGERSDGQPFARLPIWSCTARSLPSRACHHARWCALTLSPDGPHRFTHHPLPPPEGEGPLAGLFSVALVVARRTARPLSQPPIPTGAPPLAGSLPFGVRTFLPRGPFKSCGGDRPTCP